MIKRDDRLALDRYKDKLKRASEYNNINIGESDVEKRKRIERARRDYAFCVSYYFPHYATCECADFQIQAANWLKRNSDCVDLEIWPRGHAKSVHMDILWPFWMWINNEIDMFVLIGANETAAADLMSDLQAEFEANQQIINDFGEQRTVGDWELGNFVTKNGTPFYSLGRGQKPRGKRYRNKRPNIFVFDDIDDDEIIQNPRRVKRVIKWIFGAVYGAADNKGCRMVFANNIIGPFTIITEILKRPGVRKNIIRALDENGDPVWHQKYTRAFFDLKRSTQGDYLFQTEYMNNPQTEGEIFRDDQIQWAPMPRIDQFDCLVGHWDVAYAGTTTADYNAVKIWGLKDGHFYHIKAFVKQCKMDEAMLFMVAFELSLPKDDRGNICVKIHWRFESQFWNDALKMILEEVRKKTKFDLQITQCERPIKNKFDRILTMQPYYQNRKIYYNKKEEFNLCMQTGLNQLKSIEPGYKCHDDGPDADEGAISYLSKFLPNNNPLPIYGLRPKSQGAW